MLPDHCYQLLTAYVDGELSTRQRKAALRLLKKSAMARNLLSQLQEDARALHELPRIRLDQDLSADIVRKIRERRLQPFRPSRPQSAATVSVWTSFSVAASFLLLIGGLSYFLFLYSGQADSVAKHDHRNVPAKDTGLLADNKNSASETETRPDLVPPENGPPTPNIPHIADSAAESSKPVLPDQTKHGEPKDVLATPGKKPFQPEIVDLPFLPVVVRLRELDQERNAAPLRDVLTKSNAFRLELPGLKDSHKALDRIKFALKNNGFAIIEDSVASIRSKQRVRTNYVIYAEDLTRDELYRVAQQLGNEDRIAESAKAGEGQMPRLVVTKLAKAEYKELSDCAGVEILAPLAVRPAGPRGVDPRKPLNEGTADQVVEKLKGIEPGKSPIQASSHVALVVAPTAKAGSAEVKRFLEQRKPVKPGSVQVMIVLSY